MRQSANAHINELDLNNPIFVGYDTIRYNRYINTEAQTAFDRNLRASLDYLLMATSGSILIIMTRQLLILMFSAEELLVGTGGGRH